MYSYIKGTIVETTPASVVIDNGGIGYLVHMPNGMKVKVNQEVKLYIFLQVKEDGHTLFGFLNSEEKFFFEKLIQVKNIGPKTAVAILGYDDFQTIVAAIETSDVSYLKKLPGVGPKAAQQIILDLKGKLVAVPATGQAKGNDSLDEAKEVLIALGYKNNDVEKVIRIIGDQKLDTNGYVKAALAILASV